MRVVFADTGYWIALLNPNDELHEKALTIRKDLGEAQIVTSEMVLVEVLNYAAGRGLPIRGAAADLTDTLWDDPSVEIVRQTSRQFELAVEMYHCRLDHRWSLTDCASFLVMEERNINEALAYDRDFEQAGFLALLREDER